MIDPKNANVAPLRDFISNSAAQRGIVVNATLRHEEHLMYSDKLLQVARQTLNGIKDLQAAGLVVPLGGMGTMLSLYERAGDMTRAVVNMDGATQGQKDRLTFDDVGVPVPVISKPWELGTRQLEASRKRGEPLSTTTVGIAGKIVFETIEDMLFNGVPGFVADGKSIYGYTTFPERNTVELAGSGWTVSSGRDIVGDTKNMLQSMYDNFKTGPFTMYVSLDVWAELQMDYSTSKGDRTFIERILAFPEIKDIKPSSCLPTGEVVLVQLTDEVVDLAVGQDVVNIEWGNSPMVINFLTYGCMVPRIKADKNGNCGVVHASPA